MNVIVDIEETLGPVQIPSTGGWPPVGSAALMELGQWAGQVETDSSVQTRLGNYWELSGTSQWTPGTAWSSAFLGWLMQGSGFPAHPAHFQYVEDIADGEVPGWTAYSIPQSMGVPVKVGDVLVRPRTVANSKSDKEYWWSHGDAVWKIEGNKAHLIGGNRSNTVLSSTINLDEEGRATNTGDYLILLRKSGGLSGKKNIWPLAVVAFAVLLRKRK